MTPNKGRAFFALAGYNFNPDLVTEHLGLRPTLVNAAGAHADPSQPVISSWELSTDTVTDNVDVYELTNTLIKQLDPVKDKILEISKGRNLSPRIGVVLELSVDKEESVPEVGFGARTIRFLADIGAFINVDYQLSERV